MILSAPNQGAIRREAEYDAYPSRVGNDGRILQRLDPVVYAADHEQAPLAKSQVDQYQRDGFVVLENLFSSDEVHLLQDEVELLRKQPGGDSETRINEPADNTLRSIFAIHHSNTLFERLACDSRLVDVARYLLDDEVYIHQSRLNYKPGFRGKEFYWHSDFETWHVEDGMPRMRALSMSITLSENSACNGALMLIPGSHKSFVCCAGFTPKDHFRDSLRKQDYGTPSDELLHQLVKEGGIVTADARPGSIIVFDCNTIHGSNGNITPWPRSNAFFVYNAMSNRVVAPFCEQAPRPEYICTRRAFRPAEPKQGSLSGE
ncbi:MAG: ectoine hydroxylase [Halieaceae bacterium]|jgi:ectoine hydroxylase|nr:ectoine hydroxylase [Halieaceae bacterium]